MPKRKRSKDAKRYRKASAAQRAANKALISLIPEFQNERHWSNLEKNDQIKRRGERNMVRTADRMKYDRPVDGQAVKIILKDSKKFESNYERLHDTPV